MKNFIKQLNKDLSRQPNCSKNDFGHILMIGGDYGMGGAIIMAAEASYRTGAGRVTLLTREENFAPLLTRLPNAMTININQSPEKIFKNKDVIVIGCGLGTSKWSENLFDLAMSYKLPKVIDADALNILACSSKKFDLSNCVITPHIGEASRLLGITVEQVQKNRESSVEKLYQKFGAVAVLKGNETLIFGHKRIMYKCPYGNAGMATAGMGDILSGIIGGFLSQKLEVEKATIYGTNTHSIAGDLVAKKQGEIGMMPSDLFEYIPQIINQKGLF